MFDTAKIQYMMAEFERFVREHEDIYLIPEWRLTYEEFALFRRMRMTIRAVVINVPQFDAGIEIFGCPIMPLDEAIKNFTPQTGIIRLSAKPQSSPLNAAIFTIGNQQLNVPVFTLAYDEVLALYDRLTLMRTLQQYQEDGIFTHPKDLAMRFARGLTTFLNPDSQNIKIQFWDRADFTAPQYDVNDTAIVLRGQVVYENRYTEKTLEFYRATYPNIPIIVSTWKNELTDDFRAVCKKNSVVLLENIQPEIPGVGHLNYQLENAFKGVDYVHKNLGVKFILMARTDQRLNKPDFLLHFRNLIKTFPPHGDKLQGRIITLGGWVTKKYMPFSTTDFLVFGCLPDILKLYDLPRFKDFGELEYFLRHQKRFFDMRQKLDRAVFENCALVKHRRRLKKFNVMVNKFVDIDIFWMKNFYRKYIGPLDKTTLLETWWKFVQDYLLFVDSNALMFDWPKHEDERRYNNVTAGIEFANWLDLYRNFRLDWSLIGFK